MHDILVRATRLDDWEPAVRGAAHLAASLRANLTAIHALPLGIAPLPGYDPAAIAVLYAQEVERELARSRARAPAFTAWASSLGVAHAEWIATDATVGDALAFAGNWHDVLVLGVERAGEDPWAAPAGVARTVLSAGLPCLVVPPDGEVPARCERIVVAWNGSVESIRALHGALPLLRQARDVRLLVGEPKPQLAPLPAFDLGAWCARHVPEATTGTLPPGSDDGDRILRAAHDVDADLLVLGAYGRSRFAEWVLGGVTRHVLQHARVPLLMRH
jgi:nucleotide-binding universal stress UspA family protein